MDVLIEIFEQMIRDLEEGNMLEISWEDPDGRI